MASQTQNPTLIEARRIARRGGCMVCEKAGVFRVYRKTPTRAVLLGIRSTPESLCAFVIRVTTTK